MRISDWSSDVCSSDLRTGASDGCPCGLNQHRTGMARSLFGDAPMPGGAVSRLMHAGVQSKESNETCRAGKAIDRSDRGQQANRSEEHTSELQSLMRISYAVFCLKKKIIVHPT